jgi:hypothetical protein
MACGREGKEKMETKTKKCSKCLEDLPLESFSLNRTTRDGREYRCKECKKKQTADYREKKSLVRKKPKRGPKFEKEKVPATNATPDEIIEALRKGFALQIIAMIKERFGL